MIRYMAHETCIKINWISTCVDQTETVQTHKEFISTAYTLPIHCDLINYNNSAIHRDFDVASFLIGSQ